MSFSISSSTNVKGLSIRISDGVNGTSLGISTSTSINNTTARSQVPQDGAIRRAATTTCAQSARILLTSPAKRCKPWSNWHRALSERQPRQGVTYVPRHGATR